MNDEQIEQLDWQAFLYIAGELSDGERAEFEARLGDDPQACEAVARQVEWTSAAAAAFAPEVSRVARKTAKVSRGGLVWRISMGVAACLAVAAFVYYLNGLNGDREQRPDAPVAETQAVATEQLATAWSETVENWPLADDGLAAISEPEIAPPSDGITDVATPDWMRIAIEGLIADGVDLSKEM